MSSQPKHGLDDSTFLYGSDESPFELSHDAIAGLRERLEIQAELGRGGMGIVFKATDLETRETIAVKVLRPEIASRPEVLERFRDEVRLARRITHKNICRTHELLRLGEVYVISMEFVEGETLRQLLARIDGFSTRKTVAILRQLCSGLREAHAQGVIHRDLKPENIILDSQGNVKIMDFGIARAITTESGKSTKIVGTPAHMAPEQAQGKPADARTDIYALGLILYEMLTGQQVFTGDTPIDVAMKQISEKPRPLRDLDADIPSYLERITLKCLEKDPAKRFQTVEQLERELSESASGTSTTTSVPVEVHYTQAPSWDRSDWILAIVAVLGAIGFGLLFNKTNLALLMVAKDDPVVIQKIAEDYAAGYTTLPSVKPSVDAFGLRTEYEFAVKTQGNDAVRHELTAGFPLWEWYVQWDDAGKKIQVWLSPDSKFLGFVRGVDPKEVQKKLTLETAKPLAEGILKDAFGIDPAKLKAVSTGEQRAPDGSESVSMVWEEPNQRLGMSRKYGVGLSGGQLRTVVRWDELPATYKYKKAVNWEIPTATVFCFIVAIFGFLHSKAVELRARWRVVTTVAAFVLGGWGAYWDVASDDSYRPYFFGIVGLVSALVWFFGTVTMEHSFNRLRREKLDSLRALFGTSTAKELWGRAVLRGTFIGCGLLLIDSMAALIVTSRLHGWLDGSIHAQIQPWYVCRWWPGLQMLLSALLQAVGIGLLVGFVCALTWRAVKSRALGLAIASLLLGLSGTSWYMATIQPNYWKVLLLIIEFFVLASALWKYDFLTCLSAIFTFSFVWGTVSILALTPNATHSSEGLAIALWLGMIVVATIVSVMGPVKTSIKRLSTVFD